MSATFNDPRLPILTQAIASLCPGAQWTLTDSANLATLIWQDGVQARPADSAVNTEAARISTLPPPTRLSFTQFMALFTAAEQTAIINATDTQTKLFLLMAGGAGSLQLTNSEVAAGVNYLAATSSSTPPGPGLISPSRVAKILAGQAPS
jgi:hypothetical protein